MPTNANSASLNSRKPHQPIVSLILMGLLILPFVGCSDSGNGAGPLVSSLSTPTDNPASDAAESDADSLATDSTDETDPTASTTSAQPDTTPDEAEDPALLAGSPDLPDPTNEVEDPTISVTSTPTGATARLTWDVSPDPNVLGYFIHYGKQSSGEPGSCSYEESQRVGAPPATITGLDPNMPYFFAISAFSEAESEAESPCSNEVLVVTPAVQS